MNIYFTSSFWVLWLQFPWSKLSSADEFKPKKFKLKQAQALKVQAQAFDLSGNMSLIFLVRYSNKVCNGQTIKISPIIYT